MNQPLSRYLKTPRVSAAATHLNWHDVQHRVRKNRRTRAIASVGVVLLATVLVVQWQFRKPPQQVASGAQLAASDVAQTYEFVDGSKMLVSVGAAATALRVDNEEIQIQLLRGRVVFEVTPHQRRRFVVDADGVLIAVIGTQFGVSREGHDVEVDVKRGVVEVRDGNQATRLSQGQSWRRAQERIPAPAMNTDELDSGPPTTQTEEEEVLTPKQDADRAQDKHRDSAPRHTREASAAQGGHGVGRAEPTSSQSAGAETGPEKSASEAFAIAMKARAAGHLQEAVVGFRHVSERWPSSAFASMSAFEWGRIALEQEGDARQAAAAFERAVELATSEIVIDDAMARRVEAYARFDIEACQRTRAEYLRRLPQGLHVREVSKACPP